MKNQRAIEIKVGLTVLLGLIVFIWILGWTKNFTFSSSDNQIRVRFTKISGLETGNNVTVNGVRKGYVEDYYIEESYVIVVLNMEIDVHLKKDAAFFLESTDLMGGRKIEVYPGLLEEPLDFNIIHNGTYINDIAGVISMFSELQDKINIIANETAKALQVMNSFFEDEELIKDLKDGISNLNKAAISMEQAIRENEQNLKVIIENTKEITYDTKNLIAENKDSFEATLKNLNTVMLKSDSLITSLNYLTQETARGKNNLGKILYNDSLYNNVLESMESLKQLTKIMQKQLESDGLKVDAYIF